jgi:hypothetical protein
VKLQKERQTVQREGQQGRTQTSEREKRDQTAKTDDFNQLTRQDRGKSTSLLIKRGRVNAFIPGL